MLGGKQRVNYFVRCGVQCYTKIDRAAVCGVPINSNLLNLNINSVVEIAGT